MNVFASRRSVLYLSFFLATCGSVPGQAQSTSGDIALATPPDSIPAGNAALQAVLAGRTLRSFSPSAGSLPDAPSSSFGDLIAQQTTQQTPTPPPNETDAQRRQRERDEGERQVKAEEKQRIAGVVPDFNVVLNGQAVRLTPGQKWDLVFHTSIDPYTIGLASILAGFDEVNGSHNGYGWGPQGYFKRFGAQYADTVDGAVWGNAILPIILHQDPRYFRKATGSIKSRIIYSALSTIICRGDNGHTQFSYSNVGGNIIAGAISNLYYPADERGIGLVFENAATVTAEGALGAQLLEFSPDLLALYHRHKQHVADRKAAARAAAAQPTSATATSTPAAPPALTPKP